MRIATGWGDTQLRIHLDRLAALEYVLVHRGGRGQSFVYELLWRGEGKDGRPFLLGLLDTAALVDPIDEEASSATTTETSRGEEADLAGGSRPHRGAFAGGSRGEEDEPGAAPHAHLNGFSHEEAETPLLGVPLGIPSYPPPEPKLLLRRAAGRL